MKTLLKIIEEKMMLIEELRKQLAEKTEEAKRQHDSSMFWYDKFNELKQNNENIR
jgi:hypothetical protein